MKSFIEHKSGFYEKYPDGYVPKSRPRRLLRIFLAFLAFICLCLFAASLTGCAASLRVKGTTDRTTQQHYEYEYGVDYSKFSCTKTYSTHKKI